MYSYGERGAWFQHIETTFHKQLKANVVANVCVFQVPKSMSSIAPEAYAPQMVGLGPYHHFRPEVQDMQNVKLDATCRFFKGTQYGSFKGLTARLSKLDQNVRACYPKFLELDDYQLAWIMAVDSSFLFDFLCRHSICKKTPESSEWLQDLAKPVGCNLAKDAILRDVIILENQIPIFFMEEMLRLVCSSLDANDQKSIVEDIFPQMLVAFCEALSPIKEIATYPLTKALKRAHLLDLLYDMVVPQEDELNIDIPAEVISTETFTEIKETGSSTLTHTIETANVYGTKALGAVENSNLPIVQTFAQMAKVLRLLPLSDLKKALLSFQQEAPVADDILIPGASNLAKARIKFHKTKTIMDIRFDNSNAMFYLPVIQVGVNTEVIIRNLVAYEAVASSNSLKFAYYVKMMSGLINTVDDVKLLRDSKILISHLKNKHVTSIFNSASKSIQSAYDYKLDLTITEVKKFYNDSWNTKVRMWMSMSKDRFWKILALLAILFYLLLIVLQSFCSAYNCARLYR